MEYLIKDESGEWVSGMPTENGQHYRFIDDAGGQVESYWGVAHQSNTRITRLAFRNRFTFAERVAVESAGDTDAAVRVLLKDQEAATFIDLSREDTQQGVQLLVSKNLLTAERAAAILDPVVQPGEAYQG